MQKAYKIILNLIKMLPSMVTDIVEQKDYSKHNKRKNVEKAQIGLFLHFEIDFIVSNKKE